MSRILAAVAVAAVLPAILAAVPATSLAQEAINNTQDQEGDVLASQTLNVVENDGLTQGEAYATGNALNSGNQSVDATLYNYQFVRGNISGDVRITGTNTGDEDLSLGTPVYAISQGIGNYASHVAENGDLSAMNTRQVSEAEAVTATTHVTSPNNAIYISGEGDATSEVNHTAYQVTNGRLDASSWQTSATDSKANVSAIVHYSPSPNAYNASATNNYYSSYSDDRGSQEHETHQGTTGDTQARSEVYGGNMWLVSASGTAVANNVDLQNQGGSLVVDNRQAQDGAVQAQAVVNSYEYGEAHATASGIGNNMAAGNNDIYVRIDNDQVSSGGVDASASFEGATGWDAYVTADAVGNQALGYACAECGGDLGANNTQLNNSDVTASAVASVAKGRSIVSTARATGNSATYYVSGSGH